MVWEGDAGADSYNAQDNQSPDCHWNHQFYDLDRADGQAQYEVEEVERFIWSNGPQ